MHVKCYCLIGIKSNISINVCCECNHVIVFIIFFVDHVAIRFLCKDREGGRSLGGHNRSLYTFNYRKILCDKQGLDKRTHLHDLKTLRRIVTLKKKQSYEKVRVCKCQQLVQPSIFCDFPDFPTMAHFF